MEQPNSTLLAADSTVRSQDSNQSSDSKDTKLSQSPSDRSAASSSKDSKPESSCLESKHSKDQLLLADANFAASTRRHHHHHHHREEHRDEPAHQKPHQQSQPQHQQHQQQHQAEAKDDSNVLMFTSCGQLLLGIVLVVFGILTLVHGASLSGSGAGIWAGVGALAAGALGVVATLSSSPTSGQSFELARPHSSFSSAHLAASLVALALSNLAAITALTAVVRDAQRSPPDVTQLEIPADERLEVEEGWAGLLSSIGLLVASAIELFVSGYTSLLLAPKLCDCLRAEDADVEEMIVEGKALKTRNMVQQWVIAQNHVPKNQPIYVVQPILPVHPLMQAPYGIPTGKYATAAGIPTGYGALPMLPPHVAYPGHLPGSRPPSQITRGKQTHHQQQQQQLSKKRRHSSDQSDSGCDPHSRQRRSSSSQQHQQQRRSPSSSPADERQQQQQQHQVLQTSSRKRMSSIGEDQLLQQEVARTYTGLDKRISEEFISIAMDPERKSKASSHHGSEIAVQASK